MTGYQRQNTIRNNKHYIVRMSRRFVVLSLLSSILLAFAIGQISSMLLERAIRNEVRQYRENTSHIDTEKSMTLPSPKLHNGKGLPPKTLYTAKYFDTSMSNTSSRWIVPGEDLQQCEVVFDTGERTCRRDTRGVEFDANNAKGETYDIDDDDEDKSYLPKGQHLLMDIENVNGAFLNSEGRLAQAMLDLVEQCGLTLLSYHCHALNPSGVSCAGVLLESHVSFHTWPGEGVITLDLFTCGDQSLLPVVSIAERLFGIPQISSKNAPHTIWAHKMRGFADTDISGESEATDFYSFPIGIMTDFKKEIVSEETEFQRVDVYDVIVPRVQSFDLYQRSLLDDGSYYSTHPDLFRPDRIVFLDGVMQSRSIGNAAYHEALVHPSMFAHPNPKRVAIIGGGEGATLREVLKHNTVETVVMIEIDKGMIDLSRKYLPEWNDCTSFHDEEKNCFDESRVEVYCEDAFAWFIDRFGGEELSEDPFDVIIMDALDPQIQIPFVEALYDGGPFLNSIPRALSKDGIFVGQLGEAPLLENPAEELGLDKNRANFLKTLSHLDFMGLRDYIEAHNGFFLPWQFIAAFKSIEGEGRWMATEAATEYNIRSRLRQTHHGESPLDFFDGSTMTTYQYPAKPSEVVFCRSSLATNSCSASYSPAIDNTDLSQKIDLLAKTVFGLTPRTFCDLVLSSRERGYQRSHAYLPLPKSIVDHCESIKEASLVRRKGIYDPARQRKYSMDAA